MLARKMAARLEAWRAAQGERPKAFLLSGARQTGKTFTVREFARQHYANYIEVNFLDNEDAASLLTAAQDSDELVTRLSLLSKQPLDAGRTLVFFDEIQASPDMLTVAKFLVEQDRFDLVLSGSLLGVELRGIRSFPVGYLHEERMYPLDFEEFCWALQVPARVIDEIRAAYRDKRPLEVALHDRLVRLYRLFIVVGGMPEVVQRFIDSKNDLAAVREVQSDTVSYTHLTDERFERVFDYMETHEAPRQKIFFDGQVFDAFELLVSLVQRARHGIVLVDGYADVGTLNILAKKASGVAVTLWTHPKTSLTAQDLLAFNAQYPSLTVEHTTAFHDRFLILDETEVYLVGLRLKMLVRGRLR